MVWILPPHLWFQHQGHEKNIPINGPNMAAHGGLYYLQAANRDHVKRWSNTMYNWPHHIWFIVFQVCLMIFGLPIYFMHLEYCGWDIPQVCPISATLWWDQSPSVVTQFLFLCGPLYLASCHIMHANLEKFDQAFISL